MDDALYTLRDLWDRAFSEAAGVLVIKLCMTGMINEVLLGSVSMWRRASLKVDQWKGFPYACLPTIWNCHWVEWLIAVAVAWIGRGGWSLKCLNDIRKQIPSPKFQDACRDKKQSRSTEAGGKRNLWRFAGPEPNIDLYGGINRIIHCIRIYMDWPCAEYYMITVSTKVSL